MTLKEFTEGAKTLARNPLGIIALFIVLIYGFASLVLTAGGSSLQSAAERLPIVWFLTLFPVAVLVVFAWLVASHHEKLYGPADYAKDETFLQTFGPHISPPEEIRKEKTDIATSDMGTSPPATPDTSSILDSAYSELVKTGYCLLHAAEIVRKRTTPKSGRYHIRVWIEPIEDRPLSDIESVTYRVWDDFPRVFYTTRSQESEFDIWISAYGEFPVLAFIRLKSGQSIMLQRYLDIPGRPPD